MISNVAAAEAEGDERAVGAAALPPAAVLGFTDPVPDGAPSADAPFAPTMMTLTMRTAAAILGRPRVLTTTKGEADSDRIRGKL